jgi:hypothetical protein
MGPIGRWSPLTTMMVRGDQPPRNPLQGRRRDGVGSDFRPRLRLLRELAQPGTEVRCRKGVEAIGPSGRYWTCPSQ